MKTYEEILNEALGRVPDTFDKREGSIIYNALAPSCYAISELYRDDDILLNETFADTASRNYLIKRCDERNVIPYPATASMYEGTFNTEIELHTKFKTGEVYTFVCKEFLRDEENNKIYKMECETLGTESNSLIDHELIPQSYINGLQIAKLTKIITLGTNEEDTEHLRERYFESLQYEPFAGNKKAYRDETNSKNGIIATKVYSNTDTEKDYNIVLIVAGGGYTEVSEDICKEIQEYYSPENTEEIGKAPIFHKVHVESCKLTTLDFKMRIDYAGGGNTTFKTISEKITIILQDYIQKVNEEWETQEKLIIRINVVMATLYENLKEYVKDITALSVNNSTSNINLDKNNLASLGTIEEMGES